MPFKIEISYYDLAQCAGIELYFIHPKKRDRQQLKKDINSILNRVGLKLTSRPYWLDLWEVVAIDGWTKPAEMLFESHWHFKDSQEQRDYDRMPVHIFVENYIGYLKYTRTNEAIQMCLKWRDREDT